MQNGNQPVHVFEKDNEIGKRGEKVFERYLKSVNLEYRDVSNIREYQEQDVDFIVSFKNPQVDLKFEVKNDTRIATTGNIFFETMSNVDYSTNGCFNKTKSDVMVIVSESERRLYMISSRSLKRFVDENKDSLRFISRVPGSNSCGYLVPVKRLGDNLKIKNCDSIFKC